MKRVVTASSQDTAVKLRVEYEVYERFQSGGIKKATVSGQTLLDALKKMCDKMGLYITSEDIEDKNMTAQQVIEQITYQNCD